MDTTWEFVQRPMRSSAQCDSEWRQFQVSFSLAEFETLARIWEPREESDNNDWVAALQLVLLEMDSQVFSVTA